MWQLLVAIASVLHKRRRCIPHWTFHGIRHGADVVSNNDSYSWGTKIESRSISISSSLYHPMPHGLSSWQTFFRRARLSHEERRITSSRLVVIFSVCPLVSYWTDFGNIWHRRLLEASVQKPRLPEKLTHSPLVRKFPAFYRTRRFVTAFTTARHLFLS